jgi:hypothetical protein
MNGVRSREAYAEHANEQLAWLRACFDSYEQFKARWAPIEARHLAAIKKIKKIRNYYATLAAVKNRLLATGLRSGAWSRA